MRRLVYISRSLCGTDQGSLEAILNESRARNSESGVTGMLWWGRDTFAQVLEGEPSAVEATMRRIQSDTRHADIGIVEDRHVRGRLFGEWSMLHADDGAKSTAGTAYLVGFCRTASGPEAERLCTFLMRESD